MTALSELGIKPSRLGLGGNVFGWTADRDKSFAVLDAYADAGGNFIDSADAYSMWVPGHSGGESETIIGEWLKARGRRDDVLIATKLGQLTERKGLSAENIRAAADDSLRRLGVDTIDLYYAHIDDESVPLAETLGAFGELIEAGKVRAIGASNYRADRLEAALETSAAEGVPLYAALQTQYNLVDRSYEDELQAVCESHGVACVPYQGLAGGFLTGKYRPGEQAPDTPRAPGAMEALESRNGPAILEALDSISEARSVPVAAVALAWLAGRPTVVAPLAGANSPEQLQELLAMTDLQLSADENAMLDEASRPMALETERTE